MSDQLRIAAALRKLDNASLEKLITLRMVNTAHLRDFFDFADALSAAKSVSTAVASLSAKQIMQLEQLAKSPSKAAPKSLVELMLVYETTNGYTPFDCVLEATKSFEGLHAKYRLVASKPPSANWLMPTVFGNSTHSKASM